MDSIVQVLKDGWNKSSPFILAIVGGAFGGLVKALLSACDKPVSENSLSSSMASFPVHCFMLVIIGAIVGLVALCAVLALRTALNHFQLNNLPAVIVIAFVAGLIPGEALKKIADNAHMLAQDVHGNLLNVECKISNMMFPDPLRDRTMFHLEHLETSMPKQNAHE